ncbi:MAG: hypothetical protein WCI11_15555 [Candidatus Methylumidiphilus sp.]
MPLFRHGLPEPSHREVNLRVGALPKSYIHPAASYPPWHWIPPVHGGMTADLSFRHGLPEPSQREVKLRVGT